MGGDSKALARLSRTVAARIPATLDDPELVARLCSMGAAWLLADPARLKPDAAGRLRLAQDASVLLKRLGRSVGWMADERHHHGQQAAGEAAKALRGLRSGRLDMDRLLDHASRFRVLRRSHIRRNVRDKVHAPAEAVALHDGAYRATRVTSERALNQLGQDAGNCLASPYYRRFYADGLRRGTTAFWRIDPIDAPWMDHYHPIWVVALSVRTGSVEEVQQVGGTVTLPTDRDVLLEFLAGRERRGTSRAHAANLADHAISPILIEAARSEPLRRLNARMAGGPWRFEVAPGVMTVIAANADVQIGANEVSAIMLHGPGTGARMVLSVLRGWSSRDCEDPEAEPEGSAVGYQRSLAVRLALREACARSPALRRACQAAFAGEGAAFREDWFGPAAT